MGIAYLSPEKSPYENFLMIAQHNARTTKAHAELLKRSQIPIWEAVKSAAIGFFMAGAVLALFFPEDRKFGIGMAVASMCLFLGTHAYSKNLDDHIKKEAEKSKKILGTSFLKMSISFSQSKANAVGWRATSALSAKFC